MPTLQIKLDGDNCWPELKSKTDDELVVANNLQVAFLPGGMSSGKASITIRVDLPDGRTVLAETSHALFEAAAAAFRGRAQYLEELASRGGRES